MMKIFKNILFAFLTVGFISLFTHLFINAWDNTMTDEEIVYYLEKYPNEQRLIKLAEKRNIVIE